MLKPFALASLLALSFTACASAQTLTPVPSGPFPEEGTFCAPFKRCTPDLVTRLDS